MRASVRRRLQPVLDAQRGVVTTRQLVELRIAPGLARREGWLRLADGTWCVAPEPDDAQLLTGLRLYSPTAVASGALACRQHDLRHVPDVVGLDAVAAHSRPLVGSAVVRVHQTRRMPAPVPSRDGEVARKPRAVVDTARWTTSLRDTRALVLAALADAQVTDDELRDEVGAGRRAVANLRRALVDWERGAKSAPEAEAADVVLRMRRARPFLLNPELWLDGALLGVPDGWFPDVGLGWEMDSREFHAGPEQLDTTLARHQRFDDNGLALLHVTPGRFRENRWAWARDVVTRAERRAGWQPPPGLVVVAKGPLLAGDLSDVRAAA